MIESTAHPLELRTSALLERLRDDPWSLSPAERAQLRAAMREEQAVWLRRLEALVEPPDPPDDIPAFLLETEGFAWVRSAIESGQGIARRDTAQRFVDHYRHYLGDGR